MSRPTGWLLAYAVLYMLAGCLGLYGLTVIGDPLLRGMLFAIAPLALATGVALWRKSRLGLLGEGLIGVIVLCGSGYRTLVLGENDSTLILGATMLIFGIWPTADELRKQQEDT